MYLSFSWWNVLSVTPGWCDQFHILELGVMCCILSLFHVSSRIMANNSEPSFSFSLVLETFMGKTLQKMYYPYFLCFVWNFLLVQIAFLISCVILTISPHVILVGLHVALLQFRESVMLWYIHCKLVLFWPVDCVLSLWGSIAILMFNDYTAFVYPDVQK